ncbi:hypothetical protein NL108_018014 [Boleophthalmus pectinirostris]|nr:hypothetical protein NL108_018014 [Boleophthalmus pectinirostris]
MNERHTDGLKFPLGLEELKYLKLKTKPFLSVVFAVLRVRAPPVVPCNRASASRGRPRFPVFPVSTRDSLNVGVGKDFIDLRPTKTNTQTETQTETTHDTGGKNQNDAALMHFQTTGRA